MGGGGKTDTQNTIRYAPYLEKAHGQYLNHEEDDEPVISFTDAFNATVDKSPYGTYTPPKVDDAFFGDGYHIENFPSLWDMFGKFMGGMDVCDLWGEVYENVVHGPELNNTVHAQAVMLEDETNTTIMPSFLAGMRDINAVMASSFVIGKSIIADAQIKSVNKFAADLRLKALDESINMWAKHLDWNKSVSEVYAEYFKLYYTVNMEEAKTEMEFKVKDVMWNMSLFDDARAMIGALNGAQGATSGPKTPAWMQYLGAGLSILGTAASFM